MKKALKISALLMALIVMAAFAVVFTFNADDAVKLNNTNLDALKLGGTFELEENIGDITNTEVITLGEKVTIDLKGYTITSGCVEALFNQGKVANPGIIKIIDTVGGGAIIAPNAKLFDEVAGTVHLQGGAIVAAGLTTDKTTAVITIKGSDVGEGGELANTTWTSFDPTEWLVDDYSAVAQAHPVVTDAGWYVYPTVYNIFYEIPGNATNTENPVTYTIETPDFTLKGATAKGYTFSQWYIRIDGVESPINTIYKGTSLRDITLVGKFDVVDYEINYNLGNGMVNNTANPETFTVEMPNIPLGNPSLFGYTFEGWYTDEAFTNRVYSVNCGDLVNNDVLGTSTVYNLYPKFTVDTYNITYITFDGIISGQVDTYTVNDTVDLTAITCEKAGYDFDGWYLVPVPGEADAKQTAIGPNVIGDVTLYAVYTAKDFTITYESEKDIANKDELPGGFTVETPTFKIPDPTPIPGYTFLGWYNVTDSATGVKIEYVEVGKYFTDLTIEARWEVARFPIHYELMVGNNADVNNAVNPNTSFAYGTDIVLYAPSRQNYDFLGWYYADPTGLTGEALDAIAIEKVNDTWVIPAGRTTGVRVWALWVPTVYTITYTPGYQFAPVLDADGNYTYDANGDVAVDTATRVDITATLADIMPESYQTEYTIETKITLPVPTLKGYTFEGWNDPDTGIFYAANSNGTVEIPAGARNGNFTLEAQWKIGRYDLVIEYRYNEDFFKANEAYCKSIAKYEDAQIMWKETLRVVFGTGYDHVVTFEDYNGFIPDHWTIGLDEKSDETETLTVYFEPVVHSTEYKDGKLVFNYWYGSKEIAISAIENVYIEGNGLYLKKAGEDAVQIGTIPTLAQVTKLEESVNTINTTLNEYKALIDKKADTTYVDAEIAKVITQLSGIIDEKVQNLIDSEIADLTAAVDAASSKAGTSMILAIIALIVAIGAVAVAFIVGKKH